MPSTHAKKSKAKNRAADSARLAAVRKMLAAEREGKKLLALAREKRVPIFFSADPKKIDAAGVFDIEDKTVALNPEMEDKVLARVLAHELRHMWQSCVTDMREQDLSAADRLVRRRLIEGDAYAFETRFLLSPQLRTTEKLAKMAAQHPMSPEAREAQKIVEQVRAEFGMKASFMKAQKEIMGGYDKTTLRILALQLEMARHCARQKKLLAAHPSTSGKLAAARRKCDRELKNIFNRVSAPRPLAEGLVNVTREGLSPRSPNYLGFTTTEQLAPFIRGQIPEKTLKKAQALEGKIRKTAARALGWKHGR